jgi:hypothetical protein
LAAGDEVRRPSGQWVRMLKVEARAAGATVYNFEVANNHTYFVGRIGVLVHNTCTPRRGRAPEYEGGQISEDGFLDSALDYLGPGYREVSPGRCVSADGMRQVRYGAHATTGARHHGHFEAYDSPGWRVIENTVVDIVP